MLGNGEQNYGYKKENFATAPVSEQDRARGKLLKSHNVLVAHQSADNIKKRHHIKAPTSEGAESYYSSSNKIYSFHGTSQNYIKKQLEKQPTNFHSRNVPNRNSGYKVKNHMHRSSICSRRIHELAQPNRRYVLESWQNHAFRYTPSMAEAARKRLAGVQSSAGSVEDPEEYYASLKSYLRNCHQARVMRRRNAAAKKKREMIKNVKEWSQNLSILFAKEISKIMDQAHLFKTSPRVLAVSERVLKGIMDHLNEKAPTGNHHNNLTKKVLTEMANALAFWINAVISKTDGSISEDVETTDDIDSSTSSVVDEEEISQEEKDSIENISLGEIRNNSANIMKVSRYIINELMNQSNIKTTSLNLKNVNDTKLSTPKEIVASILSAQPETKNILQKLLNILSMAGENNVFYGDSKAENITFGEIINRIKTLTNSKPEMEAKKNVIKNKLKEKIIKLVKHKKSEVLDNADMKKIISEVAAEISKWLDIKVHVPQSGEEENISLTTASSESTSLEARLDKDSVKIEEDIESKCDSDIDGDESSDELIHAFENTITDVMQEINIEDVMKIKDEISQHKTELHISKELPLQLINDTESEQTLQPVKKTHGEINLQLSNRLKIEKISKINKEFLDKVSKEEEDTHLGLGYVKQLQFEKVSQSGKELQEKMDLPLKQENKTTPFSKKMHGSQVTDQATNTDVDETEVQPGTQIIEVVLQKLKDNVIDLHNEFNTKSENIPKNKSRKDIDEPNIINDLIDFSSNPLKFSQAKISVIDSLIKEKHKALGGEVTAAFSTIIMDYINLLKNIMDSTYKWQSWVKSTNESAKKIAAAQKLETKSSNIDLSNNTWKCFIQRVDRKALLWRQYNNYAFSIANEIEKNIIANQLKENNTATEEATSIETGRKESNSANWYLLKQKFNCLNVNSSSDSVRNELCMSSSKSNTCQHPSNPCNSKLSYLNEVFKDPKPLGELKDPVEIFNRPNNNLKHHKPPTTQGFQVNSRTETACESSQTDVFLKENVIPNINEMSNAKEKVDLTKREHSRQGKKKESKGRMKIKELSSKETIFLKRPGTPISSSQKYCDYQVVSNSLTPETPTANRFQKQLQDQVQETKELMNKTQNWGKWMHNMVQKATQINENKVDDTYKSKFYKKMNKDAQAWKLYKEYATQQADQHNRKLIEMNGRKDVEEAFTKRILQVEDFAEKTKKWAEWMKSMVKKTESALKVETPDLNKVKEKMRNEVPKWTYFRQHVENVISKDADSKDSIQIEAGKREYVEPVQETNVGEYTNFTEPIDKADTTCMYRPMFEEYDTSVNYYDEN